MVNLINVFQREDTIPVGFIVEPLVKQLQIAAGDTYIYNTIDFEFFNALAKHPKLSPQHALHLIDTMAKIYLNDLCYATSASVPFLSVARRFITNEAVFDFLVKFMTMIFSMLPNLDKIKKEEPKQTRGKKHALVGKEAEKQRAKEEAEQLEDLNRGLKKTYIIEILKKIQLLKNEDLNDMMRTICLVANKKSMDTKKKYNVGIIAVMNYWGNGRALCDAYVEEERRKVREEQERIRKERERIAKEKKEAELKRLEE